MKYGSNFQTTSRDPPKISMIHKNSVSHFSYPQSKHSSIKISTKNNPIFSPQKHKSESSSTNPLGTSPKDSKVHSRARSEHSAHKYRCETRVRDQNENPPFDCRHPTTSWGITKFPKLIRGTNCRPIRVRRTKFDNCGAPFPPIRERRISPSSRT